MNYANKVLSYLINETDDTLTKERASYFIRVFDQNIFKDKHFYFYELLKEAHKMKATLTKEVLITLCKYSLPTMIKTFKKLTPNTMGLSMEGSSSFKQIVQEIEREVIYLYETCILEKDEDNNYKSAVLEMKNEYLLDLLKDSVTLSIDIAAGSNTKKSGITDAVSSLRYGISELDVMAEKFDDLLQERKNVHRPEVICEMGFKTIDDKIGGIMTTDLSVIAGSSGQGKTTFALCSIAYNALVINKLNVIYLTIDQPEADLQDKLIARHINLRYKLTLSPRAIGLGAYDKNPEVAPKIAGARYLLFDSDRRISSDNVGKFVVVEAKHIFSNTIIDTVIAEEHRHHIKFDLVIIDYGSGIQHKRIERESLSKEDVVREVYSNAKQLALSEGKAVVCLEQYTREGITKISRSQDVDESDLAGGMYVSRFADNIFCMTGTKEERHAHIGYMDSIKVRNADRPPKFKFEVNAATGLFREIESEV